MPRLARFARRLPITLAATTALVTFAGSPLWAAENTFAIGLTAVSGMNDLEDAIVANNPQFTSTTISAVGLSASYTHRLGSGWGVTGTIGPIVLARGDASFSIVPLGISARYDFAASDSFSPYVRLGVEKAFVNGDLVDSGSAGGVIALGAHFGNPERSSWGIELAGRGLKVKVPGETAADTRSPRPYKGSITVFWSF